MGKVLGVRLYFILQVFIRTLVFMLRWAERFYFSFRQKLFHLKAMIISGFNGQIITSLYYKHLKVPVHATYEAVSSGRLGIADSFSHHVFPYLSGHLCILGTVLNHSITYITSFSSFQMRQSPIYTQLFFLSTDPGLYEWSIFLMKVTSVPSKSNYTP